MKNIVLWMDGGANQVALANKVHKKYNLSAIVVERRTVKRKITLKKIYEKIYEKIALTSIQLAWDTLFDQYSKQYPKLPDCPILETDNINNETTLEFMKGLKPDIIMVSGTRLVKKHMFDIRPNVGFINLHTGLSPYVKGGPNCTNWCIANNEFHLIGNTIMWLDEGIDTGRLITTDTVAFTGSESLYDVHYKVMEHAHQLYIDALGVLIKDAALCPGVPQNTIDEGKTYYTRMWGMQQKKLLIKNFKTFNTVIHSGEFSQKRSALQLVRLPVIQ